MRSRLPLPSKSTANFRYDEARNWVCPSSPAHAPVISAGVRSPRSMIFNAAISSSVNSSLRDPLRRRLGAERGEPGIEARRVIAAGRRRGRQGEQASKSDQRENRTAPHGKILRLPRCRAVKPRLGDKKEAEPGTALVQRLL